MSNLPAAATGTPLLIDAAGSNTDIGRAHALATLHLKADVEQWVTAAEDAHPASEARNAARLDEVVNAWQDLTPGTLEQVEAMAEVYQLPSRALLTAILSTYLRALDRAAGATDGCTTMALPDPQPLLMKNRDNESRFLGMQTLLRVRPERGYPWLALSTAGAPAVHSSGMNSAGLSIADTHVPARDIGPGVPRFSSMMQVLEQCATTTEAIDYLLSTPQMGLGNLTMVDAAGHTAVVECGYTGSAVLQGSAALDGGTLARGGTRAQGAAVATNHYVSDYLSTCLLEAEKGTPGVDSRARRAGVITHLLEGDDDAPPSIFEVRSVAAHHVWDDGTPPSATTPSQAPDAPRPGPGSLCKHGPSSRSETISTTVFDPQARTVDLCIGQPCSAPFYRIGFEGEPVPAPASPQ